MLPSIAAHGQKPGTPLPPSDFTNQTLMLQAQAIITHKTSSAIQANTSFPPIEAREGASWTRSSENLSCTFLPKLLKVLVL